MVKEPDTSLLKIVEKKVESLLNRSKRLSELIKASLIAGIEYSEPVYTMIHGWNNILEMIKFVISSAKYELIAFIPVNLLDKLLYSFEEARRRGVFVSIVVSNVFPPLTKHIREGIQEAATIAGARTHGTRLIIVADSKSSVLVPLTMNPRAAMALHGSYIEDPEIAFILTSYYYNRVVTSSIEIYHRVEPGDHYVFKNLQSAMEYIERARRYKYELEAIVKGLSTFTGVPVELHGQILGTIVKPHKGIYSIVLDTGGVIYTIGGYRAFIEDITARRIEIKTLDIIGEQPLNHVIP
ncbi:MAG: hypothetical protein J7K21_01865 [Desulfurococcales archaeon]|nr:hypothetical protein [Desulfurococcales archaeon]